MKDILTKVTSIITLITNKLVKINQKLSRFVLTNQQYNECIKQINALLLSQVTEFIIKPNNGYYEYENCHLIQLNPINDGTNHIIDWGDGTIQEYTTAGNYVHKYASANENYTIKIYGSNSTMQLGGYELIDGTEDCFFARNIVDIISISKYLKSYENIFSYLLQSSNFNQNSSFTFQIPTHITDCSWIFYSQAFNHIIIKWINQKNYKLPDHVQEWDCAFYSCEGIDVTHLFDQWNSGKKDVSQMFTQGKIVGTLPADKLWNNTNIIWINQKQMFSNCDLSEVTNANEIPASWRNN